MRRMPITSSLATLFVVLLVISCTTPVENTPTTTSIETEEVGLAWEEANYEDYGYTDDELRTMQRFIVDSSNTTGLVVIIDGKKVLEYGDIEDLSYLASCRKSILAMLYGKYVENGTIDLSKTLAELGMDDVQGLMDIEKTATIDHLITARSGIYHPASNSGDNSADAPARGSQTPGEYFLYNNWDFNAAGAAFEQETGINIYDALEKDLAIPLGMQDWDRSAQQKFGDTTRSRNKAYHIWLSTRDMAKIGQLMLNRGKWNGQQIISEAWADKIVALVTPLEEMNPERMRASDFGYSYMWWIWDGDNHKEDYNGAYTARGAWGQYITVIPEHNMVVAHKTNSVYRRRTSWNSYQSILDMIVDNKN